MTERQLVHVRGHSRRGGHSAMLLARSLLAALELASLAACGLPRQDLPPCWRAADLRQGDRFRGTVLILAGYNQRPMIFPVACDGGVTADLPEGFVLPGYLDANLNVPPERLFYEAYVDGRVTERAFGRPSVRLEHVSDPRHVIPNWLRDSAR